MANYALLTFCLMLCSQNVKRVNMHVNAKMIPVEIIPSTRRGWIKGNSAGGEFKYNTIETL
jgi:hypothetical protein